MSFLLAALAGTALLICALLFLYRIRTYQIWLAFRSIVTRGGGGLSFMTVISLLGIAVGVSVLVVVITIMGGMERNLKKTLFRGRPHLEVYSDNILAGFSYKKYPKSFFTETFSGVKVVEPFTRADVILKRNKHLVSATILGIEPTSGGKIWGLEKSLIQGSLSSLMTSSTKDRDPTYSGDPSVSDSMEEGLLIGESLAASLNVGVGDSLHILSPQAGLGDVLTGGTIARSFKVVGVFYSGQADLDQKYVVANLNAGRRFLADYDFSLDEDRYVTGVAMQFATPSAVDRFDNLLLSDQGLELLSWKAANHSLLFALLLEKFTMATILLLIVVVAAFSISGTMMMNVFHKQGQVSLMRSLGMSQRGIFQLFLMHGNVIGLLGIGFGMSLGLAICEAMPPAMAFIEHSFLPALAGFFKTLQEVIPSVNIGGLAGRADSYVRWILNLYPEGGLPFLLQEYCLIGFSAWLLSLFASLYPAILASKQDPGVGLRWL